ncbi:hypothetical protein [Candidatus Thiosymbion oneisti]|uniref:hypothetical protein n=1 Tax=Candidatus Thiosymbion oneisti TaxID=589554 RepID=UPI0010610345|nr:hypothetical protein [Candidatus Thiosymbion oneisti]
MSVINLVVALPAEAKPVISRFGLARVQADLGFPLYRHGRIALVVTGPGKPAAVTGTDLLATLGNSSQAAIWVNLGVAGHAERQVGEVLLARSITDAGSGHVRHPILPQERPCPADDLLTLDRPDLGYRHKGMVDMEASGFFPTACRYASTELVQVLKVVSDNRKTTARGLSAKQVHLLMGGALDILETLLASLEARAEVRQRIDHAHE